MSFASHMIDSRVARRTIRSLFERFTPTASVNSNSSTLKLSDIGKDPLEINSTDSFAPPSTVTRPSSDRSSASDDDEVTEIQPSNETIHGRLKRRFTNYLTSNGSEVPIDIEFGNVLLGGFRVRTVDTLAEHEAVVQPQGPTVPVLVVPSRKSIIFNGPDGRLRAGVLRPEHAGIFTDVIENGPGCETILIGGIVHRDRAECLAQAKGRSGYSQPAVFEEIEGSIGLVFPVNASASSRA